MFSAGTDWDKAAKKMRRENCCISYLLVKNKLTGVIKMRMIKRFTWLLLVTVCLPLLVNMPAITYAATGDSIAIASITPDAYPNYTDEVTFTVSVNYTLQSVDTGIIYLGFNTSEPDRYTLCDEVIVTGGSGVCTLTARVLPAGWGTPGSPSGATMGGLEAISGYTFGAYVNISDYPHPESWKPLATNVMPLRLGTPTDITASNVSVQQNELSVIPIDSTDSAYIYEPSTSVGESFVINHDTLRGINDTSSAKAEIFDTVSSLTAQQRQSGDALDDVALYIENVLRLGASRSISGEVPLAASTLAALSAEATDIMTSAESSLRQTNVNLLRSLRTNLTIKSDETESLEITFPDNVTGIDFDNVTVDTEFASVTLNKDSIQAGGSIELRKVSLDKRDEATKANTNAANNGDSEGSGGSGERDSVENRADKENTENNGSKGITDDKTGKDGTAGERSVLEFLLDFWCIGVIVLILIIWGVLTALKHRLRVWVVPAFTALALVINLGTYFLLPGDKKAADEGRTISARDDATSNAEGDDSSEDNSADDVVGGRGNEASDDGGNSGKNNATTGTTSTDNANGISSADLSGSIEVTMSAGIEATISMPAEGGDKDFLMLFNEEGEAQYSKYNYVTDTVDARVKESGIYSLKEYEVSFVDIEKKNDLMQEAILQLASKGLMSGTTDGFFYPDKMITRAELVSAIVRAFDLLDTGAQSRFSDLDRSDWYYSAAASAEKEQIINGFEDNTFRGEQDIPKDQLVAVSANTLIAQMGYLIPADIEAELERYLDRSTIPGWAEESIALATQSNIMIYRTDSLFAPKSIMTRGDAAIILYRVFSKAW